MRIYVKSDVYYIDGAYLPHFYNIYVYLTIDKNQ